MPDFQAQHAGTKGERVGGRGESRDTARGLGAGGGSLSRKGGWGLPSPLLLVASQIRTPTPSSAGSGHAQQRPTAYTLARLQETARTGADIFAELLQTVCSCSLGQITHALYEVGGQYRRSM
jgi:hypothetical protein